MSDKLYEYMDWPEIEAVVYSEESEPRKILGPRVTENGILIQSFLNIASSPLSCCLDDK